MTKPAEEYLRAPYARIITPAEDGTFSAEILEFPGCYAEGNTPEEAFESLEGAAEDWIEAAMDLGQAIPEPSLTQGYSGRVALRMPRSIHRQASRYARRDDTSLNQFLLSAIATRVGAENFFDRLVHRLGVQVGLGANTLVIVGSPPVILSEQYVASDSSPDQLVATTLGDNGGFAVEGEYQEVGQNA